MPRFSIIVTCYNQERLIGAAVESALNQSFRDREVIVVDDHSTDGSAAVLAGFGTAIRRETLAANSGAPHARNRGASLAGGDYLVFLDGDDLLVPWALEIYRRIVDEKSPELILGRLRFFRGDVPAIGSAVCPREAVVVAHDNYFSKDRPHRASASATVVSRRSFSLAGGWTCGTFPLDDQDLLLKLGLARRAVQILSPETALYRVHDQYTALYLRRLATAFQVVLKREQSGRYPGGRHWRWARYGVEGGVAFFLAKRSASLRQYRQMFRLLAAGWLVVACAILRRGRLLLRGQRPSETLSLEAWAADSVDPTGVPHDLV